VPGQELFGGHGAGHVIALTEVDAHPHEQVPFLFGLDAFGDCLELQALGEVHGRFEEGARIWIGAGAVHEGAVELQLGEGETPELREAREARAEIVDREQEAFEPQPRRDVEQRLKGFLLAIDDFGTGFSSLTQLRRLPFTELKLDRTFVQGACTDPDARSVLESSVNLAKRLQLKTVAEGIETEEEWNLLVWMGVDLGQGYYMARPMPADKLLSWRAGWQSQVA
jgi:hypothetical protein